MNKSIKFLLDVWQYQAQPECYFCISVKRAEGGRWKDIFFQWPIKSIQIKKVLKKYPDKNHHLYFCPLPFREARRKREFVLGSRLLWADLDEANPHQFDPIPQIAWESSPGRFASLWILNQFHTPLEIEPVNRGLTYHIEADKAGWDLTQVLRIPGLRNLKYKAKPKARLLWMTDNIYDIGDIPEPVISLDPRKVLKDWKKKLPRETLKLLLEKHAKKGKRSDVIWKLENSLVEAGLSRDECFTLIKGSVWNKFRGRNDEDRQLRRELDKAIENKPALAIRDTDRDEKKKKEELPLFVRMDTVDAVDIDWLWYPYIARGKVTMLEGDPGLGKSWVTLALSSYISNRRRLPGAPKKVGGNVLIFSAEDDMADTIKPRLMMVKAKHSKVYCLSEPISITDEDDMEEVLEAALEIKPALIIVDPIVAYMGVGTQINNQVEIQAVIGRLKDLAEELHCAVVCVRHLRKSSGQSKAIYEGMGSIGFTSAARSVLLIRRHPEEAETRLMFHIKSNAKEGDTVRFQLIDGLDNPFRWDGVSKRRADDEVDKKDSPGKSESVMATEFLTNRLSDGKEVNKLDLIREAEAQGISKKQLIKARRQDGYKTTKRGSNVYWIK